MRGDLTETCEILGGHSGIDVSTSGRVSTEGT